MSRPTRFEHSQYLGDKRSQRVYDLDLADSDPAVAKAVADIMASEQFAAFSPDTLAEARNRGYRLFRSRSLRDRGARPQADKSIRNAAEG